MRNEMYEEYPPNLVLEQVLSRQISLILETVRSSIKVCNLFSLDIKIFLDSNQCIEMRFLFIPR